MSSDSITNLRRYLVECAQKFNYRFNGAVREDIRRTLFHAASVDGKYIKTFFPDIGIDFKGKSTSLSSNKKQTWIMHDYKENDPSHPGRPCLRKFTKGEPTYMCL